MAQPFSKCNREMTLNPRNFGGNVARP